MENISTTTKPSLLVLVALAGLFYIAGQYVASQPQRVEKEAAKERQIAVQGRGEIEARPDIAEFSLGVQTGVQASAADALKLLTTRFTAVEKAIKDSGVDEKDITTTNLSIQPQYDYNNGQQTLRGFVASENVTVKIRDLDKIGAILASATGEGVNQAGGLQFTFDDPDVLQQQAEEAAINDAKEKAEQLADALGVRLGSVKSYSSSSQPKEPQPMYAVEALGRGGDASGPPVPSGSQKVTADVTITYELR